MPQPAPPDAWRMPAARPRNPITRAAFATSRRRYGHVVGPVAVTAHHARIFAGWSAFEYALERAGRVDPRLKEIAASRAATLANSPFCVDFALAELPKLGYTDEQLRQLPCWRDSESFTELEQLVLEYAEAMTATPVEVSDQLFKRLRAEFDYEQLVELTTTIAFENYRARFNQAVGLIPEGFCELLLPADAAGSGHGESQADHPASRPVQASGAAASRFPGSASLLQAAAVVSQFPPAREAVRLARAHHKRVLALLGYVRAPRP